MEKRDTNISKCMYVDLSNVYGGITELFDPGVYIDFSTLMPMLDEIFEGIDKFKVYGAYMGYDGLSGQEYDMAKAQNEFFNSARLNGVHFGKGVIRNGQEKSVDMQIGVDMVNDAHNGDFTDYILFSGDADFSYPVSLIKEMGKNFHYCAFAGRYSPHFAGQAWRKVVLDYNGHFRRVLNKKTTLPKKLIIKDIYSDKSVKTRSIKND